MKSLQSCTKPSMCQYTLWLCYDLISKQQQTIVKENMTHIWWDIPTQLTINFHFIAPFQGHRDLIMTHVITFKRKKSDVIYWALNWFGTVWRKSHCGPRLLAIILVGFRRNSQLLKYFGKNYSLTLMWSYADDGIFYSAVFDYDLRPYIRYICYTV